MTKVKYPGFGQPFEIGIGPQREINGRAWPINVRKSQAEQHMK